MGDLDAGCGTELGGALEVRSFFFEKKTVVEEWLVFKDVGLENHFWNHFFWNHFLEYSFLLESLVLFFSTGRLERIFSLSFGG